MLDEYSIFNILRQTPSRRFGCDQGVILIECCAAKYVTLQRETEQGQISSVFFQRTLKYIFQRLLRIQP